MGDMSKEPSMEEILSSIKRIIAEDGGDQGTPGHADRLPRPLAGARRSALYDSPASAAPADLTDGGADDEILELTDSIGPLRTPPVDEEATAMAEPERAPETDLDREPEVEPAPAPAARRRPADLGLTEGDSAGNSLLSRAAEAAALSSLAALSAAAPTPGSAASQGQTIEAMVQDMLRPLLKDWLDQNLPTIVQDMVAKEITRLTGRAR